MLCKNCGKRERVNSDFEYECCDGKIIKNIALCEICFAEFLEKQEMEKEFDRYDDHLIDLAEELENKRKNECEENDEDFIDGFQITYNP